MWTFSCDDPAVMGGKKMWLRPGDRYVFGRVRQGNNANAVEVGQRTISKAHLIISLALVAEGSGTSLLRRSKVTLQDCNSKHGTRVDGVEIRGKDYPLAEDRDSFIIMMGRCEKAFRLDWVPIILSFSLTAKEKQNKFIMAPYRNKLEDFDIKTIPTWTEKTSHVVASKRNTSIGLQALINGRHIVTSDYIDAIVAATKKPPTETVGGIVQSSFSPLELDFEGNFPDPTKYLPDHANEPVDRPPKMFRPDPNRKKLFDGWTVVFLNDRQYGSLLPPITDAQGKAELFKMQWGRTTPQEIVDLVKKRGSDVAVVRPANLENKELCEEFSSEVEAMLGYRMILQNEFLDIILTQDTSKMKIPVEPDTLRSTALPASSALPSSSAVPPMQGTRKAIGPPPESTQVDIPSSIPETQPSNPQIALAADEPFAAPPRRVRARRKIASTTFSFDLGGDFLPPPTPAPETQAVSNTTYLTPSNGVDEAAIPSSPPLQPLPQSQYTGGTTQLEPEWQTQIQFPPQEQAEQSTYQTQSITQKRRAHLDDEADAALDIMDLLPAAKQIKRRKVIEAAERATHEPELVGPAAPEPEPDAAPSTARSTRGKRPMPKAQMSEEDVLAQKQKEIREAQQLSELQESREEEDIDIEKLRNLAIVEAMPVKPRNTRAAARAAASEADPVAEQRWKPEWSGRKNFKKFRRKGVDAGETRSKGPSGRLIISMVEHKGRDYGLGDGYWLEEEDEPRVHARTRTPAVDSQSHYTTARETETPKPDPRAASRAPKAVVTAPRSVPTAVSTRRTPSLSVAASTSSKRPAATSQSPVKRQRRMQLKVTEEEEENSEDEESDEEEEELKFKFRRGRRRK